MKLSPNEMSDLEYYKGDDEYDEFKEYLDLSVPVESTIDDSIYPPFEADYSTSIIVDNIPVVTPEKAPKLIGVLMKVYSKVNQKIAESDIHMPSDPTTGESYGFCFIKFNSVQEVNEAIRLTQGFALDKKHNFKVNAYKDMDYYANIKDDDKAPELVNYHPRPDVSTWLSEDACRDQFYLRHGKETEIYFANTNGDEPSLVYGGEREKESGKHWCELNVEWSPKGTYFVTFHKPGVKLWGGPNFDAKGKFNHKFAEKVIFSPCELYIITIRTVNSTEAEEKEAMIVWDVRSGEKLRAFPLKSNLDVKLFVQANVTEIKGEKKIDRTIRGKIRSIQSGERGSVTYTVEEGNNVYENVPANQVQPLQDVNVLKWSSDGKYLARLAPDMISIFDSSKKMALLDQRSLATKDVLDFSWSPSANLISYISPAVGNYPAMISILSIPDRKEVCSRKIIDITDGKLYWQNDGEYLCVSMIKNNGKKKNTVLMFFCIAAPGIPVEQTEFNESVLDIHWEPSGNRILIIKGETRNPVLSFCRLNVNKPASNVKSTNTSSKKTELVELFQKTGAQCNAVEWAPVGGIIALAHVSLDTCIFELFDVENNVTLASRRHDRCNKMSWDPSGRYLATFMTSEVRNLHAKGNIEDGVNFYTFQGNLVNQVKRERMIHFGWRPRPKDLLTAEEKKKVKKSYKQYEKRFESEDKQRKQELNREIQAARFKLAEEFLSWRNKNRSANATFKKVRVQLRSGYDSDDDRNYDFEVIH